MSARDVDKTCLLGYDLRAGPKTVLKPAVRTMLVPVPKTAARGGQPQNGAVGGQPVRDTELLTWCGEVIRSVLADL
jgi:transcription-repair coupling factor (superfamily II helicase)